MKDKAALGLEQNTNFSTHYTTDDELRTLAVKLAIAWNESNRKWEYWKAAIDEKEDRTEAGHKLYQDFYASHQEWRVLMYELAVRLNPGGLP